MIYHDEDITEDVQRVMYRLHTEMFKATVEAAERIGAPYEDNPLDGRIIAQVIPMTVMEVAAAMISANLEQLLADDVHAEYISDCLQTFIGDLRDKCGPDVVERAFAHRAREVLDSIEAKEETVN